MGRVAESQTQAPVAGPGPITEPERVMTRLCSRGNVSDCTWRRRRRARLGSERDWGRVWNWFSYSNTKMDRDPFITYKKYSNNGKLMSKRRKCGEMTERKTEQDTVEEEQSWKTQILIQN